MVSGSFRLSALFFLSVFSFISCKNKIVINIESKVAIRFLLFFFVCLFSSQSQKQMVVKTKSKVFVYIDLDQFVWHPSFFIILFVKVLYFLFFNESILKPRSSPAAQVEPRVKAAFEEPQGTPADAPRRKSHPLPLPGVVQRLLMPQFGLYKGSQHKLCCCGDPVGNGVRQDSFTWQKEQGNLAILAPRTPAGTIVYLSCMRTKMLGKGEGMGPNELRSSHAAYPPKNNSCEIVIFHGREK